MFSKILGWSAVGLFIVGILAFAAYLSDMRRAYTGIEGKSTVIPSLYSDIEYVEGGSGPPVLVIHGSGGGYDQGELMIDAFLGDRFHWIAPSRFGYLRSTFQEGATFRDQAHAYAALLDHLGIERVAVVALSHGGPSALLFATLYPERVSCLTLISTGVTALSTGDQAASNLKGSALTTIYQHDWLYWGVTTLFNKQFLGLMGVNDADDRRDRHIVARLAVDSDNLSIQDVEHNRELVGEVVVEPPAAQFQPVRPAKGNQRVEAVVGEASTSQGSPMAPSAISSLAKRAQGW